MDYVLGHHHHHHERIYSAPVTVWTRTQVHYIVNKAKISSETTDKHSQSAEL